MSNLGILAAHNLGSRTAEWRTDPATVARAVRVLGAIDLDPCADPQRCIPAAAHYTEGDDGLALPWRGRVFVNPPYGRALSRWMAKLATERDLGRVTEAITLTPASTDVGWFAYLWDADALCFVRGRLRFSGAAVNAPHSSVIGYFGKRIRAFADVFGDAGKIIYPNGGVA